MQNFFFLLLLTILATTAGAQNATTMPQVQCLEERPEYTATAAEQVAQCEKNPLAKVQVVRGGQYWPVYLDLRTDDVFALVHVPGKGYKRVVLDEPILAKAD